MKKITKQYLCKLGYFKAERLSKEEELKLDPRDESEELIIFDGLTGGYYGYRVKDEDIDLADVELFLRAKRIRGERILKVCAVICTVCMVLITLVVWL